MVFLVSELFDISLDELLRGEDQMIENMAEDMNQGKKRKKTHSLLSCFTQSNACLITVYFVQEARQQRHSFL